MGAGGDLQAEGPALPGQGEGEHRYIPLKVLERLKGLPEAVAQGKPLPETIRLTPEGEAARRKAG